MAGLFSTIFDHATGWLTKGGAASSAVKWVLGTAFNVDTPGRDLNRGVGSVNYPAQNVPQVTPAPKALSNQIRLTRYGTVIPRISGVQIIELREPVWKGPLQSTPFQSAQGVKYHYHQSLAYIICVGEIDTAVRWWENGVLRAEYGSAQSKLPGTLYVGSETQAVDPTMSAIEGAANTPAFRGVAWIMLPLFYLGTEPSKPEFKIEVYKSTPF